MSSSVRSAPPALPPALRPPIRVVSVLAALMLAVLGVLYSADSAPSAFDAWVLPSIDGVRPPWGDIALVVDFGGEPAGSTILVAAVVAGCLLLRRLRTAILTVIGVGLTIGLTSLLKPVVGRTIHGGFLAFPSGHTALATALALIAALLAVDLLQLGRAAGMLVVSAAALLGGGVMAWAEVALGAHYPTDALGGFCTALAIVPATAWGLDRIAGRP